MRLRGIENHYKLLVDLGFAPATVRNLLGCSVRRIDFEHLERICLALNCTPNDILEWLPAETHINAEAQDLIKLKRDKEADLSKLLSKIPMEKFEEIAGLLQDSTDTP